jgi:hypothetical protein
LPTRISVVSARQAAQCHVVGEPGADRRQCAREFEHVLVLRAFAHFAELRVILVLLAPPGVAPRRLDVPVGLGADPHVGPGGRDGELADALQRGIVAHRFATRLHVAEAFACRFALDAALLVGDVAQAGGFGSVLRIEDRLVFGFGLLVHGLQEQCVQP